MDTAVMDTAVMDTAVMDTAVMDTAVNVVLAAAVFQRLPARPAVSTALRTSRGITLARPDPYLQRRLPADCVVKVLM